MAKSDDRMRASGWKSLPRMVRLIVVNSLVGASLGAAVSAALLAPQGLDLGQLASATSSPWMAASLLVSGMMGTFAGLSAATAIMLEAAPG